eukprot:gnl/MRDRNA2_/MRDRNA2_281468_c0_seq1.p1 gnl/MRDRNA2_/MRDRNA2_281468_c0~~gnl/MRDRNA2_/MRDRNA2_281468_c0_seq1.p1  ORF type:complete len:185 (+),score=30.58 gnl/MRDRNA2_/MRDRNA2_281468_c0_seq1:103-657(+)
MSDKPVRCWIRYVNKTTKWVVAGAVVVAVAWGDLIAPYSVIGGIVISFVTKAIKRAVGGERPKDAPKEDGGMPSSHALLSAFFAAAFQDEVSAWIGFSFLGAACIIAWLRVAAGYHTVPQVIVGLMAGFASGRIWACFGSIVLPMIKKSAWGHTSVYGVFFIASLVFAWKFVRRWLSEAKGERR